MRPEQVVVIVAGLSAVVFMFRSVVRLFERRIDARAHPVLNTETDQRIARIEQAVDSIAVEVERISEGQRFTTKLLSDRIPGGTTPPSAGGAGDARG